MRKFLTLDGDVLEHSEWAPKPKDRCFYCDISLIAIKENLEPCWESLDGNHDWITLVNPANRR